MGERDDARRQVEQKRERMSRIAHEVSRRMTPRYAKERAREMARERMYRARDRAVESSWLAPLVGAGVGALVAKALQSRAQDHRGWAGGRFEEWDDRLRFEGYDERGAIYDAYGSDLVTEERIPSGAEGGGEGAGARLGEKASEVKERARATAEDVKERARATAEQVKGRLQGATSSMRERLPDRERLRASAREDTGLWTIGALALGALFGFALPETRREREMLEPARRKARELGAQAKDVALQKGSEVMEKATEKVGAMGSEQHRPQQPGSPAEPPTALH